MTTIKYGNLGNASLGWARAAALVVFGTVSACRHSDQVSGSKLDAASPLASAPVAPAKRAALSSPFNQLHSLIELIARPETFDGANMMVCGFLVVEWEHHDDTHGWLYLTQDDFEHNLLNGVHVKFGSCAERTTEAPLVPLDKGRALSEKYVCVRGTFEAPSESRPRVATDFGAICNITEIFPNQPRPKKHEAQPDRAANEKPHQ